LPTFPFTGAEVTVNSSKDFTPCSQNGMRTRSPTASSSTALRIFLFLSVVTQVAPVPERPRKPRTCFGYGRTRRLPYVSQSVRGGLRDSGRGRGWVDHRTAAPDRLIARY